MSNDQRDDKIERFAHPAEGMGDYYMCCVRKTDLDQLERENARLRHDLERALANHSADLNGSVAAAPSLSMLSGSYDEPDGNPSLHADNRERIGELWKLAMKETASGFMSKSFVPGERSKNGDTVPQRFAELLLAEFALSATGALDEDAACKVAAELLRNEIVRLEYPKSMFPQEAEKIGRRQTAFQEAILFLAPTDRTGDK